MRCKKCKNEITSTSRIDLGNRSYYACEYCDDFVDVEETPEEVTKEIFVETEVLDE